MRIPEVVTSSKPTMALILTFVLLSIFFVSSLKSEFIVQPNKGRLIEAEFVIPGNFRSDLKDCFAYGDRKVIQSILKDASPHDIIHRVENSGALDVFIDKCNDLHLTLKDSPLRRKRSIFKGIFPGTKWCGRYNISSHYDDLGSLVNTDRCCRNHDHCSFCIDAGETKLGLKNTKAYSQCACTCDSTFYQCLKAAPEWQADFLGNVFFNIMRTECIKDVHPKKCISKGWWWGKCKRWSADTTRTVKAFVKNPWY